MIKKKQYFLNNFQIRCCFARHSSETKKRFGISSMFWLFLPSRPRLAVFVGCILCKIYFPLNKYNRFHSLNMIVLVKNIPVYDYSQCSLWQYPQIPWVKSYNNPLSECTAWNTFMKIIFQSYKNWEHALWLSFFRSENPEYSHFIIDSKHVCGDIYILILCLLPRHFHGVPFCIPYNHIEQFSSFLSKKLLPLMLLIHTSCENEQKWEECRGIRTLWECIATNLCVHQARHGCKIPQCKSFEMFS